MEDIKKLTGRDKSAALSYLRIFATIIVVCAHSWSTLTNNPKLFQLNDFEQIFLEIGWNLTKWDIPVFFMISGAIFLRSDKIVTIPAVIKKYTKRMLLALFIFGVPMGMMMIYFETRTLSPYILLGGLLRVINGNSFGHLWYMYTLIGIYLFLPVIKIFVNNASKYEYKFFMVILLIFNFILPQINELTGSTIAFQLPITTYPLFWLLMGHYIMNMRPKWAEITWLPVVGILITLPLVISVVIARGPFLVIMAYDSPVDVVLATSIFILFSRIQSASNKNLWNLDRLCFGVYLIHPIFIHFTYKFLKITPLGSKYFVILVPIFTIGFIVVSFVGSFIMSKIKPLKKHIL